MRLLFLLALIAPGLAAPAGAAAPSGWTRLVLSDGFGSGHGYSLSVPPGIVRAPIEGIDSDVAALDGPGLRMLFDYGPYGGLRSCGARQGCTTHAETIGDKPGASTAWKGKFDGQPAATEALYFNIRVGPSISLAIQAYCADEAACARATAIVHTIAFVP